MAKALQRGNGTGSVHKLSGRRKNPWRAVVAAGWTFDESKEKLIQNRVTIGYFHTKDEALQALIHYNANPYDIKVDAITFEEVYEKWSAEYFPTLSSASSIRIIRDASSLKHLLIQ